MCLASSQGQNTKTPAHSCKLSFSFSFLQPSHGDLQAKSAQPRYSPRLFITLERKPRDGCNSALFSSESRSNAVTTFLFYKICEKVSRFCLSELCACPEGKRLQNFSKSISFKHANPMQLVKKSKTKTFKDFFFNSTPFEEQFCLCTF